MTLMDHSNHQQAATDWTAVIACTRGTEFCLIASYSCSFLKPFFNSFRQMYYLNIETLLNPCHPKRKQGCYADEKKLNLLFNIKVILQVL